MLFFLPGCLQLLLEVGRQAFSFSEKCSKAFHLHPYRWAGQRSSGWLGKALDLTSVLLSSGLTSSKSGKKELSRKRSFGTFRRFWKGPHRNESFGICQSILSLQGAISASFSMGAFRTFCSGNKNPKVNCKSSCSNYTATLASPGPPSGVYRSCDGDGNA